MQTPVLIIREVDPQGDDALYLLKEAAIEARALYADLIELEASWPTNPPNPFRGTYLIGYMEGAPVVSGALRPIDESIGEVRRIYVLKQYRRFGLAQLMLAALEQKAIKLDYHRLWLETGNRQKAAIALYEATGFHNIAPFGEYAGDPTSVCYEKIILPAGLTDPG